jgi:hypothetical protein
MTQFISLTIQPTAVVERINVAQIARYYKGPHDPTTVVYLNSGIALLVTEGVSAIDDLIRDTAKTAVISAA